MRLLNRASMLVALGALLTSCSVLLDWVQYNDGLADAATGDAGNSAEETPDSAAGDSNPEAEPPKAIPDTGTDGPPACSTHCPGCCGPSGDCQGGLSDNSCGVAGETCRDCETTGLACVNRSCAVAVPSEAGSHTCSLSSCSSSMCIPVWQAGCCKSDGTCGCEALIPQGPCL